MMEIEWRLLVVRLVDAGCVSPTQDGGAQCHYCNAFYDYDPHEVDCAYVAALKKIGRALSAHEGRES